MLMTPDTIVVMDGQSSPDQGNELRGGDQRGLDLFLAWWVGIAVKRLVTYRHALGGVSRSMYCT